MIALAVVLMLVAAGAFLFWQSARTRAAAGSLPESVAGETAAAPASAAETATVAATATSTPPILSAGAVPGGHETPQPATPIPRASTRASSAASPAPATATPAAASGRGTRTPEEGTTPSLRATRPATAAGGPDFEALKQRMLERVNADRAENALAAVEWDETASLAGQLHAEEMAEFGYMSHWNRDGYGPEFRYSRAGGLNYSQENVYRLVHTWQNGGGAPIEDWDKVVDDAQTALMNSPGHRANILAPEHTHLGVGIAYNPVSGNVAIAQEFVNRYASIDPVPRRGRPGDRIVLRGVLLEGSRDPLVNVAYEPFPEPMTLEDLNQTSTYTPQAKHQAVPQVVTGADGRFVSEFRLPADAAPGLYHLLVWVEVDGAEERVPAVDAIIEVGG